MSYDIVSMVPMFCEVFLGDSDVDGGLPFSKRIERNVLDYSVDSLKSVDRYLTYLHQHTEKIEDQEYTNVVLAAGCYLGEVIRRNAPSKYYWVNYEDYFPHHPELSEMVPEEVGTSAILLAPNGSMRMPLNKIARFIGEGPENNVHFFAAAEMRPQKS